MHAIKTTQEYIFHRAEGFYIIELYDDADAIKGAEFNKGTIKVTNIYGVQIWPVTESIIA